MIPLSEEKTPVRNQVEKVTVAAGEGYHRSLGFDLERGEVRDVSFSFDIHDEGRCEVSIFIRGEGELRLQRMTNVLGNDAHVQFRIFGDLHEQARIFVSDDIFVTGLRAHVDEETKVVLRDQTRSEVRQRITLPPSAGGAVARQRIDHLLLGDAVYAEGIPELDVRLDDVTCSHAATTAKPDESMLFYLFSRGLSMVEAHKLVAHGFLHV